MAPSCRPRGRAPALAPALALGATLLLAVAGTAATAAQETYDPDVDLNTPQTVRRHGYPAEAHVVQTADGYLLTVHRIPGPRSSDATDGPAPPPPPPGPTAAEEAATSGPPAPRTATAGPAGSRSTRPWTARLGTTEATSAGTGSSRPWTATERLGTTEATSAGTGSSRPWATTAPTNGTTPSWMTAWTTPAGTSATFDSPSSPLPANSTDSTPQYPPTTSNMFTPTTTSTPTPESTTSILNTTTTSNMFTPTTYPSTAPSTSSPVSTTTSPPTTTPPASTTPTTPTTTPSPSPPSRPVIFLQHGLLGSSFDWIVAGPGKGLAYLLADAGYDVWMGNARGNTYSRAHVYLPTESSSPFWEFSFHEMGIYDLPAVIDYILNTTGAPQLHYVGHSMGTTMFFVMASTKPEVAAGVASMYALAPVVFVKHIKSPIRLLAPFARDVEFLAGLLGEGEFLPQNKILHYLAKYGCELLETEKDMCENLIFVLCGYDKPQFDTSILPELLSHTPAGASTRTVIHYAQMIKSGKFQQYDLGKYGNLKKYRSLVPPSYDLTKVNVSVHIFYANNDWLAATMDVKALYQDLHCTKTKYLVPLSSFNHLDFILAKDVKTLLYDKLLKEIPREIDYQNYEDNFLYD